MADAENKSGCEFLADAETKSGLNPILSQRLNPRLSQGLAPPRVGIGLSPFKGNKFILLLQGLTGRDVSVAWLTLSCPLCDSGVAYSASQDVNHCISHGLSQGVHRGVAYSVSQGVHRGVSRW